MEQSHVILRPVFASWAVALIAAAAVALAVLGYRYHMMAETIAHANGHLRANYPLPGGLRLDMPPFSGDLRLERATHLVQPGDLPSIVALAHNTTPWAIAVANDLRFPYLLPAGQAIIIPK